MKHPVDVHVGKRVRHRRWMVGMTQQQLGDIVGIKFQQIQKYETGMNRISASRLWDIAQALGVSISFFFEGFDERGQAGRGARRAADTARRPARRQGGARAGALLLRDPRGAAPPAVRPGPRPQRRGLSRAPRLTASAASRTPRSEGRGVRRGHGDGDVGRARGARSGAPPRSWPTSPPPAACRCSAAPGWRRQARRPRASTRSPRPTARPSGRCARCWPSAGPTTAVLGEEFPATEGTSGLTWVLDPIDGTRAFWSGATTWGTLVGLDAGDGPVLGLIDQPYTGERFMGGLGRAEMRRGGVAPAARGRAPAPASPTRCSTPPFPRSARRPSAPASRRCATGCG